MKAKLSKNKDGGYTLSHHPSGWGIGSTDHEWVSNHTGEQIVSKLSLKNCQAIERGYDLEELAINHANEELSKEFTSKVGNFYGFSSSYIKEFKKAVELMGDKKYSEEDMMNIYILGGKYKIQKPKSFLDKGNEMIKSLQQNVWNVEIIEECLDKDCDGVNRKGNCISTGKPRLDEHNCIILRRI